MRDSVPTARYSPICNVLRQWKTSLIRIYRVYRLYDRVFRVAVNTYVPILFIILKMLRSEATAGVICLPRMSLTTPDPQNTDTNGIHATWAGPYYSRFQLKTLRSEVTAHSFTFFNGCTVPFFIGSSNSVPGSSDFCRKEISSDTILKNSKEQHNYMHACSYSQLNITII